MATCRKRKGKKEKSSHGRASHTDLEMSGEDYGDLAKQFGISPDLIRRMQSHSGRLDDEVDRHENEKYL